MFKIICDVIPIELTKEVFENTVRSLPQGPVAPAAKKHNTFITYKNCKACDAGRLKLTSTSVVESTTDINNIIALWNENILSPVNENYYKAYEDILGYNSDHSNLKYIGLFTSDNGLSNTISKLPLLHVFETIIDTTSTQKNPYSEGYIAGYESYHQKISHFEITNTTGNTLPIFGVIKTTNAGHTYLSRTAAAYLLRNEDSLNCPKIKNEPEKEQLISNDYQKYIKFLEEELVAEIKSALSFFIPCKVGSQLTKLITVPDSSNTDTSQLLCEAMGGTLQSMRETIESICQKSKPTKALAGEDEVISITCGNYKSYLTFNADGEILQAKITEPAGQEILQQHDEL